MMAESESGTTMGLEIYGLEIYGGEIREKKEENGSDTCARKRRNDHGWSRLIKKELKE